MGLERVPITFDVDQGRGHLRMGQAVEASLEAFAGPSGAPTTLADAAFSSIPGSPAYLGKASLYRAQSGALDIDVELRGHNSVQGHFRFES